MGRGIICTLLSVFCLQSNRVSVGVSGLIVRGASFIHLPSQPKGGSQSPPFPVANPIARPAAKQLGSVAGSNPFRDSPLRTRSIP